MSAQIPSPPAQSTGEGEYLLSAKYTHLVESPVEFDTVLRQRMCKLQDTLGQLNPLDRRQAMSDIVYLRAVLDKKTPAEAQEEAEVAWMANM